MASEQSPLSLPRLFGDRMVVQQGKPITVWGKAPAGGQIHVSLGDSARITTAAQDGSWLLHLEPMAYGGPYELNVTCGEERRTYTDVWVGEVWVCGGQSNMEWKLARSQGFEEERQSAHYPAVRFFNVPSTDSDTPNDDLRAGAWQQVSPETAGLASGVGYFFATRLHEALQVPVGFILSSIGGTKVSSWVRRSTLEQHPELSALLRAYEEEAAGSEAQLPRYKEMEAKYGELSELAAKHGHALAPIHQLIGPPVMGPANPKRPAAFYNGMIAPLQPYSIRGALWYQGESDAGTPQLYAELLRALIGEWREGWQQGAFPFLVVQLPGYSPGGSWPLVRDAQHRAVLDTENADIVCTLDVGQWDDIHPTNKKPVGERLALLARATVYGESLVYAGPTLASAETSGDKVNLTFDHAGSGIYTTGPIAEGFEICGEDGVYHKAAAFVTGSGTVTASSPRVAVPYGIRYAWAAYPNANLYNREGLPAFPFQRRLK